MFEYRQVLTRMRLGDTDRAIARAGLMGRRKAAALRRLAEVAGWLDPATPLPEDTALAEGLARPVVETSSVSLAEPHRERVTGWWQQGIQGTTIHAALVRNHRFEGSYSSLRRFLQTLEAAQVDFGKGPEIVDVHTGEVISTWVFVMTLAFSRHAYAEIVTNQKVATWLGCHRRAFEWFGGVVERV